MAARSAIVLDEAATEKLAEIRMIAVLNQDQAYRDARQPESEWLLPPVGSPVAASLVTLI